MRFWSRHDVLRAPEDDASGGGAGGGDGEGQGIDALIERLNAFEARIDERFGEQDGRHKKLVEDVARARKMANRDGGQGEGQQPASRDGTQAVDASDTGLLWKLSKINAKLPEAAQAKIDALVEDGDIERALLVAETLVEVAPAVTAGGSAGDGGEMPTRPAPRGYGATPAPRKSTAVELPKDRAGWAKLARTNKDAFEKAATQAKNDPNYTMPTF